MASYQYVGCCSWYRCLARAAIGGSADMGCFIGLLAKICSHQSAYSGFGGLISLYRCVAKLISNLINGVFMKKIRLGSILSFIAITGLLINLALNIYAYFYIDPVSSSPLEEGWWSVWLPSYLVWMLFLTVASFLGVKLKD
jgi:hypothetical protein